MNLVAAQGIENVISQLFPIYKHENDVHEHRRQ